MKNELSSAEVVCINVTIVGDIVHVCEICEKGVLTTKKKKKEERKKRKGK